MSETHQFFTELKLLAEDFERLREENKALHLAGNEMARCILEAYDAGVISCAITRGVLASVVLKWQDIKRQINEHP